MIKFHEVSCRNFLSIGDKPIKLKLDEHPTTLVQGKNGVAKSGLFLDSLSWCLYGRAFRKVSKNQLVNSINRKDCMVELTFYIGSKEYFIRRGMYPEVFEIYENGTLLKSEAGKYSYQEMLEKRILRINHKSFCQIVTIGSATFIPFMQLSQGARREIIEDLLDLQVFSQMNRLLKNKVDSNRADLKEIRYQLDLNEEKESLHRQYIENIKRKTEIDQQEVLDNIADAQGKIEHFYQDTVNVKVEIGKLQDQYQDHAKFKKRKKQYTEVSEQLSNRMKKLQKEIDFYSSNDHCPTCRQGIDHTFKCETIDKKSKKASEISGALVQTAEELAKNEAELDRLETIGSLISRCEEQISKNNAEISALNRYISTLQNSLNINKESFTEDEGQTKLEELKEERKRLELRKAELLKQKSMYDVAGILLKDGGIKSKIIKQYIPIINATINKYLSVLDLNVQFEIDETFKETIKSRFREEFSYESFSEGEKARINLAVVFAWRAIASMRNSSSTNLLVLDEIADGGVDSEGIDDLVKILNTLKDTHVYVISHRESMTDRFPNVLKLEKVRNFSRIVEE